MSQSYHNHINTSDGLLHNIEDKDSLVVVEDLHPAEADAEAACASTRPGSDVEARAAAAAAANISPIRASNNNERNKCSKVTTRNSNGNHHNNNNKVFQGGYWQDLHRMLGVTHGDRILYVGDQMFSDILR